MSQPSCIRVTYSVKKLVRCHCSAYSFPHTWGTGDCQVSIIDNPPEFSHPRRGLSGKLASILHAYADSEDELITDLINSLTS
jgi:hypothetical protein